MMADCARAEGVANPNIHGYSNCGTKHRVLVLRTRRIHEVSMNFVVTAEDKYPFRAESTWTYEEKLQPPTHLNPVYEDGGDETWIDPDEGTPAPDPLWHPEQGIGERMKVGGKQVRERAPSDRAIATAQANQIMVENQLSQKRVPGGMRARLRPLPKGGR